MKRNIVTMTALLVMASQSTFAGHKGIKLPHMEFPMAQGKGMYAVKGMCNMCHSWGYILNQGKQSKAFWRKKVRKMINVFHAPIKDDDVEVAVNYLFTHYGNGKEE